MLQPATWADELGRELAQAQANGLSKLTSVPYQTVIYPESGWRVQDIIGHLTVWEEEVILSVQAHQHGGQYRISDFELDSFNALNVALRKALPARQIVADWIIIRTRLKTLVEGLSLEKLMDEMTYPSGRRGRCSSLLREVISHQ